MTHNSSLSLVLIQIATEYSNPIRDAHNIGMQPTANSPQLPNQIPKHNLQHIYIPCSMVNYNTRFINKQYN